MVVGFFSESQVPTSYEPQPLTTGCLDFTSLFLPFTIFFLFAMTVFWSFMIPSFPLNGVMN